MAERITIEVSASEKRLLEKLREQDLENRAEAIQRNEKPFDIKDIKPGMSDEQRRRAREAIRQAREARGG